MGRQTSGVWRETAVMLNHRDGINLITLTDLCGCSALEPGKLAATIESAQQIVLVACHPRAVKLLLQWSGISDLGKIQFFNLLESNRDALPAVLDNFSDSAPGKPTIRELLSDPSWPAWYPVIDYQRCTSCGQCAGFCLFGVYRNIDDKVVVANPQACKNNCPACARICPRVAIVFPKYDMDGSISGSDSFDEVKEMQRQKQDVDDILGGDIYHALEQRKLKRRSIIRDDAMQKALSEREKAQQLSTSSQHRS